MLLSLCPLAHPTSPMHCLTAWQSTFQSSCEPGHHILSRASLSSVLNYMFIYFVCIHILRHPYRETSGDNFEDLFISSTGSRATWVIKLGAGGRCLPPPTSPQRQKHLCRHEHEMLLLVTEERTHTSVPSLQFQANEIRCDQSSLW